MIKAIKIRINNNTNEIKLLREIPKPINESSEAE